MIINAYAVPLIVGFVVSWIAAILILIRSIRTARYSDALFSALLIASSFLLLEYMFGYMGINVLWNEMLYFPYETSLLIGPLFYLYFRAQIDTNFRVKGKQWLHFLPYVLYVIHRLIVFSQGGDFVRSYLDMIGIAGYIDLAASFLSNVIYFILTLRLYRVYRNWLSNEMPEGSSFSFQWFKVLLLFIFLSIIIMWTFTTINLLGFPLDYQHNVWQYILLSAILVMLSFEGYAQKQPMYLNFRPHERLETSRDEQASKETGVTDKTVDPQLEKKVVQLMEDQRLYLNPDISLSVFALESGFSKSDVSYCINTVFHKNFSQFVNEYRVQEVCTALDRGDHNQFSLLGIAMNAGFNSKATFNRVFKELKQMTPLQYAQQVEIRRSEK